MRDSLHQAARYGPSFLNPYSTQESTGNVLDAANKETTRARNPCRPVYPGRVLQPPGLSEASDLGRQVPRTPALEGGVKGRDIKRKAPYREAPGSLERGASLHGLFFFLSHRTNPLKIQSQDLYDR